MGLQTSRFAGIAAAVALLSILILGCGGGSGAGSASASGLCGLLPRADVQTITGYQVPRAEEKKGPGSLHYCTVYLQVKGCDYCALSLEDLGKIGGTFGNNDSASYKQTLQEVNADSKPTFQDGIVGGDSWLATATSGDAAGLRFLYFRVGDNAYDLTGPRITGGLLNDDQMIKLAQTAIQRAQ